MSRPAKIFISATASATDKYSAEQLSGYLSEITGRAAAVVEESAVKGGKRIYVGNTNAAQNNFAAIYGGLGDDGFIIAVRGGSLYLFGKDGVYSKSGTLYAVYEYLERFCGVRFFAPDEETVPKKKDIPFPAEGFYLHEKPDFAGRQPLQAFTRKNPGFAAKLRIKDCYCPATPGGALSPMWEGLQGHNFFDLVPPDTHKAAHPEWFDLENGQLCFTADGLTDEIVGALKRKIIQSPDAVYFALSQNDTVAPCRCEKCRAEYEKYTVSGTLIRFVNRAAKKIGEWVSKEFPGREVYLVTFAYYFSILPPVVKQPDGGYAPVDASVVPDKNVYIFFTTIDYCFYHGLDDAGCEWNKTFRDTFGGWRSLVGDRLLIWNYSANYPHYLYPFYNFGAIARNFKIFKEAGARHILDHGTCEAENVEFSELRAYLASKLMWNTSLNADALIKEFIEGYYREAAPCVKEYLRLLQENFKAADSGRGYHLRVYHLPEAMFSADIFPKEFLNSLYGCLDKGFAAVRKIPDAARREKAYLRLLRVSISARYLKLMNYDKYESAGKAEFAARFTADCARCGIKKHREFWSAEKDDIICELYEQALKNEVLKY